MPTERDNNRLAGVILAGGKSTRMGFSPKSLLQLGGMPLIQHVALRAGHQLPRLLVNTNQNPADFAFLGLAVCRDLDSSHQGPLLGILSAMHWFSTRENPPDYLVSFAADVPFFPEDLVTRLQQSVRSQNSAVSYCQLEDGIQPLCACWSLGLMAELQIAVSNGIVGPKLFFQQCQSSPVLFETLQAGDFLNINEPADLLAAEQILASRGPEATEIR